ncbi:hypothetical protein NBRC116584_10330 [Hydrogenophaga sp. 5NK40-0174]
MREQRKLRGAETRRRQILEQAQSLYAEQGDDGLRMRDLAERCGYTAGALYMYFRDRDALLDALRGQALEVLAQEIKAWRAKFGGRRAVAPERRDVLSHFQQMSRHWWAALMADPHRRTLLLRAPVSPDQGAATDGDAGGALVLSELMAALTPATSLLEQAGFSAAGAKALQVNLVLWAVGQCATAGQQLKEAELTDLQAQFDAYLLLLLKLEAAKPGADLASGDIANRADDQDEAQSDLFG